MYDFEIPKIEWTEGYIPKPKKPGEFRHIVKPGDDLKRTQKGILHEFLYKQKGLKPSSFAHGFVPYHSTISAVLEHDRDADVILGMDAKDFFDTFPFAPIRKQLIAAGAGEGLADKIEAACAYNGTVPQGGPCSPALTNIGMREVDPMINEFAARNGFKYTRYADDITLSINYERSGMEPKRSYSYMFHGIDKILQAELGVRLNHRKDHEIHMNGSEKRQILGIVIRKDCMGYNAPRDMRRTARAKLCNLATRVWNRGGRVTGQDRQEWAQIVGYAKYFDMIRSYGDGDAARPDPFLQPKYWNYLEPKFRRADGNHNRQHSAELHGALA